MRRSLALLALAVTTWSNVAVLRCAPTIVPASETEAPAAVGHHGHTAHTGGQHDLPPSEDDQAPDPSGSECGVVMACGTALGGQGTLADRGLPASAAEIASVTAASPSAADLTRDPPPPRRHA